MASDELRKKWGVIFMGEREATVEQLDAMQEPVRRERLKEQQQEDYLERVRAKAAERAREILGAAYAERQKVLDEARAEAEAHRLKLAQEGEALKAAAKAGYDQMAAELAKAKAEREEAERIRAAAQSEGFQAGMDQAGAELREFRAELGQSLAGVLRALEGQLDGLCASWREELVELTQAAVEAGTGWVLEKEHKSILRALVLEALNLLENRATVNLRVNPSDEAAVSDMFMAARERVPELKQWIVNGDPAIERGGLVAESSSGSVDSRREHFRELVDNILVHLALPVREIETDGKAAMSAQLEREVEKLAALAPEPLPESEPPLPVETAPLPDAAEIPEIADSPDALSETVVSPAPQPEPGPEAPAEVQSGTFPELQQDDAPFAADVPSEPEPDPAQNVSPPPGGPPDAAPQPPEYPEERSEQVLTAPLEEDALPGGMEAGEETLPPESEADAVGVSGALSSKSAVVEPEAEARDMRDLEGMPEAYLPLLGENLEEERASARTDKTQEEADGYADTAAAAVFAEPRDGSSSASHANPSLAELEEELFPVEESEERDVLSQGGFLPGAGEKH